MEDNPIDVLFDNLEGFKENDSSLDNIENAKSLLEDVKINLKQNRRELTLDGRSELVQYAKLLNGFIHQHSMSGTGIGRGPPFDEYKDAIEVHENELSDILDRLEEIDELEKGHLPLSQEVIRERKYLNNTKKITENMLERLEKEFEAIRNRHSIKSSGKPFNKSKTYKIKKSNDDDFSEINGSGASFSRQPTIMGIPIPSEFSNLQIVVDDYRITSNSRTYVDTLMSMRRFFRRIAQIPGLSINSMPQRDRELLFNLLEVFTYFNNLQHTVQLHIGEINSLNNASRDVYGYARNLGYDFQAHHNVDREDPDYIRMMN
jgi:hypothetical protein